MTDENQTTAEPRVEEIAKMLWNRFAPSFHMEWEDETHKAEYRDAAKAAMEIAVRKQGEAPF